jgi:PTS system ascorbate-specific IIB component
VTIDDFLNSKEIEEKTLAFMKQYSEKH